MRVYDASTRISAEFGGIRDLSRHLSLDCLCEGQGHRGYRHGQEDSLGDTSGLDPEQVVGDDAAVHVPGQP